MQHFILYTVLIQTTLLHYIDLLDSSSITDNYQNYILMEHCNDCKIIQIIN